VIVAANFKSNLTREATTTYLATLEESVDGEGVFVFPPSTALQSHSGRVTLGTQNAYPAQNGAFTGEIALDQLDEFGIKTILIGHSERREILGESDEMLKSKFEFFATKGFKIIYCIGESLALRESGFEAVKEHLTHQLSFIDASYKDLIIAYEPIWAIGSGLIPSLEQIKQTHSSLRSLSDAPLLYGGSVKEENIADIVSIYGVDGVLVGGASLDARVFSNLCRIAKNINKES